MHPAVAAITPASGVLVDYAGNAGSSNYLLAKPASLLELREVIAWANRERLSIRVRGHGHSMNGLAVPREGELLVSMENFRQLRVDAPDRVTVGAGASTWDTKLALEKLGIEMLVYNDGNASASTLGGYLAAGGIGHTCHRHGGFWGSVEAVTLVTGRSGIRQVRRGEPEFPWLFGSYGQLGVAVEITLRTSALPGHAEQAAPGTSVLVEPSHHQWEASAWFTVFAPQPVWKVLRTELAGIARRHSNAWQERPLYLYPIPFSGFNPPLIHPAQSALVALGLWGDALPGQQAIDWAAVDAIEADVQALVMANRDYRRYLQCEHIPAGYDYRAHYGERVWDTFLRLKKAWDPNGVLVPGLLGKV
jgi:FAD/FMN-containing dehydrogenase